MEAFHFSLLASVDQRSCLLTHHAQEIDQGLHRLGAYQDLHTHKDPCEDAQGDFTTMATHNQNAHFTFFVLVQSSTKHINMYVNIHSCKANAVCKVWALRPLKVWAHTNISTHMLRSIIMLTTQQKYFQPKSMSHW